MPPFRSREGGICAPGGMTVHAAVACCSRCGPCYVGVMNEFPVSKSFTLLEPGPVLLITTHNRATGKDNIMALSWSMVLEFEPVRFAIMTGEWNYSFEAMMANRECVLAVPAADLLDQVVGIGTCSGRDHDKFDQFGLTPVKASRVGAPLIHECLANIECEVTDYIAEYGIVVLTPVQAWLNHARRDRRMLHAVGDGTFKADGECFDRRNAMRSKLADAVAQQ